LSPSNTGVSGTPGSYERSDRKQHNADQEWNAPAIGREIGFGQFAGERERQCRQHQSDRKSDLHEARIKTASIGRRVLKHHQRGAAPFAAEPDTLDDTQHDQQDRRQHPDRRVGRQQPDAKGAQAHDEQCHNQHGFAAEPIAEMTEQCAAERPRQKADGVTAECRQCTRERIEGRKERLVEDQRCRGRVDQKIIPFNDGSKAACEHDGVELGALHADDRRHCRDGH
jgi:hypothetical protein